MTQPITHPGKHAHHAVREPVEVRIDRDRAAAPATPPSNAPFFIVGAHRAGTTLLRYMLASSPRIYIPPESDFIPRYFLRRPHTPITVDQAQSIIDALFGEFRYRMVPREWQGAKPEVRALLGGAGAATPRAFLEAFYNAYASQYGAARWADKSPGYACYMDLLGAIFPEAKFVHIIRDGRDAAMSMAEKWGPHEWHVDLYWSSVQWVRRVRAARASGARLGPNRYFELRYEQLVAEPDPLLRDICAFLDEPYHPAMARPQELAQQTIEASNGFHSRIREAPNTQRIARWRREMSPFDLHLTQRIAGPLLAELGFDLAPMPRLSPLDRLRFERLRAKYLLTSSGMACMQKLGLHPPN